MTSLITPTQAESLIYDSLTSFAPLEPELVPYQGTVGRILRQELVADRPFPPFDRITMDGIACRYAELSLSSLILQGLHPAGFPMPKETGVGHCWQVMTGAMMPADCDTVIPVEELEFNGDRVTVVTEAEKGQCIHLKGSDAVEGASLLAAGTVMTAQEVALAATVGATDLQVTRKLRVRVFSTGDELVPAEQEPLPCQIRQSNGPLLLSQLLADGMEASWEHLPDEQEAVTSALETALEQADVVLISGGISKGKKDFVRPAMESLAGEPLFHGVFQKPGKPLAYWAPTQKSPPVFALPGNPNSTLTTYHRYVRPALKQLMGARPHLAVRLPLSEPFQPHPRLTLFLPAYLNPAGRLELVAPQNSGDLAAPLTTTGFVEISPQAEKIESVPLFFWSS